MKLPIDVVILGWHSTHHLRKTISSYQKNGLLDVTNKTHIFFQDVTHTDLDLAREFKLDFIASNENIGIGRAFINAAKVCSSPYVLLLEHDWQLIESSEVTYNRLKEAIELLWDGFECIKLRHRKNPGQPLHTESTMWNELESFDNHSGYHGIHTLDSLHWSNPAERFPDKIQQRGEWFVTTSRWANFTNNPCLYKREFYIKNIEPFVGTGIDLEGNINKWWTESDIKVAHGEGLFRHGD
jgi:hypothetical protein